MKLTRVSLLATVFAALVLTAAPPTKLTVHVTSAESGKPVSRASVIVRFKEGLGVNLKKIQTSWETKTSEECFFARDSKIRCWECGAYLPLQL